MIYVLILFMDTVSELSNEPENAIDALKARAAAAGMTMSEYLLDPVRATEGQLPIEDWLAQIATRPCVVLSESPVEILRAVRGDI
jgi:hypothetical protein